MESFRQNEIINSPELNEPALEKYAEGRRGLFNKILASRASDVIPGLGLAKFGYESATGKTVDGKILSNSDRLESAMITAGNILAGAFSLAGFPAEGLSAGAAALHGAERKEYLTAKFGELSKKLREKFDDKASELCNLVEKTAEYISKENS